MIRPRISALQRKIDLFNNCKKDLEKLMNVSKCYPIMLRLAWSDAATYNKYIRSDMWPKAGGAVGSIRFDEELEHQSNAGLVKAIDILKPIKSKYKLISWADIIQMAGVLAVELTGGPKINIRYGRIDASPPPTTSVNSALHAYEVQAVKLPCPMAPFPDGAASADVHVRNIFYRMGFNNRELVALCGAHTIGRAFKDRSKVCPYLSGDQGATKYTSPTYVTANNMSGAMAGGCSWTEKWLTFDNSYYKRGLIVASYKNNNNNLENRKTNSSAASTTSSGSGSYSNHNKSMSSNDKNAHIQKRNIGGNTTYDELLWLPTDDALFTNPELKKYFIQYAEDQDLFFQDYAKAHFKMSELGSKFLPKEGILLEK